FSALDAHLKSELEQSLLDLFATYEGTILYVSHDIDEAFRFCDRIAVVSDGAIDEIAPKDELVHEPRSLAAIRLSGCKNTTPARYVSDHRVYLPEWGVEMETKRVVPHDVAWLGVRAYHIKQTLEGTAGSNEQPNVFRMRCDRVSDSRFERAVMAAFVDEKGAQLPTALHLQSTQDSEVRTPAPPENTEQAFLKSHVRWNIDKHITADDALPERGDCVFLTFPPEALYVVTH
ncbi:MAG: ABC transporter, partial [Eggerthella sp.]|nr:ABC transporter [Eggerthella sp.]